LCRCRTGATCRGYADARDNGSTELIGDNFGGSCETEIGARISCGTLNAINDEVLCFAFEAIAKGTSCEGIKLEIEHKPIRGQCKNCNEIFEFELCRPGCPKCSSEEFDLLADAPLLLEEIEFETE
jgi:hydrogenase nickel insertion protein HypA